VSPRLKIAYLCDHLGPYHFARLNRANRDVEIIAVEFSAIDQTYEWESIEGPSEFQKITLFNIASINAQSVKKVVKRVNEILEDVKPEVVVLPGWEAPASLIALSWCLRKNMPTILMSDSQRHDDIRVWWKEWLKGRIVRLNTSGFVGGTSHIAYLSSLGMSEKMISIGCDVIDNSHFAQGAEDAHRKATTFRNMLALPEHFFLSSSRFVSKKNLLGLLYAYADYERIAGNMAWRLVMLGDGPLRQQIVSLRDELGLTDKVMLPGFKQYSELPAYYGFAGAFVHASTSEQWGLVVNEAMAAGLPVIVSSRCGCAPDLVRKGRNGFTFDPFDLCELTGHMAYLSGKECNRETMGKASKDIIEHWSLNTFSKGILNAAEAALEMPVRPTGLMDKVLLWSLIRRNLTQGLLRRPA